MQARRVGQLVFAATMVGLGILGLVTRDFTPVWAPVPRKVPVREVLVYLCAVVSLGSGFGLLWRRTAAPAARSLFALLALWFLIFRVPGLFRLPTTQDAWSGCGETAGMVAAAWVLYCWFATDWDREHFRFPISDYGLRSARALYGLAMFPFGIAHFTYLEETAGLVPAWLPWHIFWAYFFGCTFLAAGLAILLGLFARLAVTLSAVQLGLFTVFAWGPIVAAGSKSAFVWSETILSVALTAGAWVVADSYRDIP